MKILQALYFRFMRNYLLVLGLVGQTAFGYFVKQSSGEVLYCHSKKGIIVYKSESPEVPTGDKITYGKPVSVLDRSETVSDLYGLSGCWLKVRYGGGFGYVHSGAMSALPVADDSLGGMYLKDYLFEHFEAQSGDENFKFINTNRCRTSKKCTIFEGMEYYGAGEACDMTERLFISDMSVQEAYVVFSNSNASFGLEDLSPALFKASMGYDEKSCRTRHFTREENGSRYIYSLSYRKLNGQLTWIYYNLYCDGGSGTIEFSLDGDNGVRIDHCYRCS